MTTVSVRMHKIAVSSVLVMSCLLLSVKHTAAQDPDPNSWQDSAMGLSVQQNEELRTAGLGFIVQAQDWPFFTLRGGVENAGSYRGTRLDGPVGIEIGQVRIPDSEGVLVGEITDWAHNEMVFRYGDSSELVIWVSRVSPAVLLHSQANIIDLFSGSVAGDEFYTNQWGVPDVRNILAPSYPKYVAYPTPEGVSISMISSSGIDLSQASGNWLLVWYGRNSHFLNSEMPLSYQWTIPLAEGYRGDVPILLVFENKPAAIGHSSEGGVRISHPGTAGHMVVLPLFGRDIPRTVETEIWSGALPDDVLQRVEWWAEHLCAYPLGVRETYMYNEQTDQVAITETFTYKTVCLGGSTYAPVPPMLGLVHDQLDIGFSGSLVNGQLNTEYGPTLGIEHVDQYTWRVSDPDRYTDARRIVVNIGSSPPQLEQELAAELRKIISAGHMAPWIFMDAIPQNPGRGDLYWADPADVMYHLLEVADAVQDEELRSDLIDYIRSERTDYPPEEIYDLPLTEGALRGPYSCYQSDCLSAWTQGREDAHLRGVSLFSLYVLARYYDLVDDPLPAETWQIAQDVLDKDLREQDWATFYWFDNFDSRRVAVRNANRHFAGVLGYICLAHRVGDTRSEALGRALLAKATVLRLGMAVYPRYLHSADLAHLPADPDWHPDYVRHPDIGYLYNLHWAEPADDARQMAVLDQFGVHLRDHSGYMEPGTGWTEWALGPGSAHLIAFSDLVPELARMLADFATPDVEAYIDTTERLFPHWPAAFAEGTLGAEHGLSHPIDAFQIFLAKALIQESSPERLLTFVDIPWLEAGDLFYIHKLAETIKSYLGVIWDDSVHLRATAGDQMIHLAWDIYSDLPSGITWRIEYEGPSGDEPSPIDDIAGSARSYDLVGLANGSWYTMTLSAQQDGLTLLSSDPTRARPYYSCVYLPVVLKSRAPSILSP